jgi:hypothetical protein
MDRAVSFTDNSLLSLKCQAALFITTRSLGLSGCRHRILVAHQLMFWFFLLILFILLLVVAMARDGKLV